MQFLQKTLFFITSEFSHPFLAPVSEINNSFSRESLIKKTKNELIDELIKIEKKNKIQNLQLQILRSEKKEREHIEKRLNLQPPPEYKCVVAGIFLRDPAFWYENFTINKGWNNGIEPGAVVLGEINGGEDSKKYSLAVVGRIEKVSEHESIVETIISRHCRLSVILEKSKAAGILNGGTLRNGKPSLKITYLPTFKTYTAGEEVKTSGLCTKNSNCGNSMYNTPPDLFIGRIAGTASPEIKVVRQLNAEAKVIPAVDFDSLRYVVILVRKRRKKLNRNYAD
jgi:cell shape-determining protein MreC